ncbi:MAG: ATP-grasp domain-containing protein [Actinomycetota bacterium]|nr:ATP-grasp domain-containing protein [Actinomycetota bacterium]MDP2287454.1 ATP-grasp domain-containing protein [Actinomycetota bacterium]
MTARPRVLVLGGAEGQLACIAACRRIDADVVLVDPRAGVPGIALADQWIALDVMQTEEIVQELVGQAVDAVLTDQSDYAARAAAALAVALGLPGQDLDVVEACSNKLVMRQRLTDTVPDLVPWFRHESDIEAAREFIAEQNAPVIVKPLQSQGSRGVSFVNTTADLPLVDEAFAESDGKGVLIEQAVSGTEYSVDGFVRSGVLTPLAISAKTHYDANPCLDERCDFLPSMFADVEDSLLHAMHRIVAALRIDTGIVHAELIAGDHGVTLVEIALRGGGGGISGLIVPFLTGFEPAEALLRYWLQLPDLPDPRDFHDRAASLRFLPHTPPADITEPATDIPGWLSLVRSEQFFAPGHAPRSGAQRAGAIIVVGDTEAEVRAAEDEAMRRLGYTLGA